MPLPCRLLSQSCSSIFGFPKPWATASLPGPLCKLVKGTPAHTPFYVACPSLQGPSREVGTACPEAVPSFPRAPLGWGGGAYSAAHQGGKKRMGSLTPTSPRTWQRRPPEAPYLESPRARRRRRQLLFWDKETQISREKFQEQLQTRAHCWECVSAA